MSADKNQFADLLNGDLAGTYPRTISAGQGIDPAVADADLARVQADGYVFLPGLLGVDQLAGIKEAVEPLLDRHGRNRFEGQAIQRVYHVARRRGQPVVAATTSRHSAILRAVGSPAGGIHLVNQPGHRTCDV